MSSFDLSYQQALGAVTPHLRIGAKVGAQRWPFHAAHPGAWGKPWAGTVIRQDDPRAWEDSQTFPRRKPTRAEVQAFLKGHLARGNKMTKIPVLWDFGPNDKKVYWESPENLRSYAEDLRLWKVARAEAFGAAKKG
jgi:hypothetical protein